MVLTPCSAHRLWGRRAHSGQNTPEHVRKADLDSLILDLKVDRLHAPGVIEAEQTGVMLTNRRPPLNRPVQATIIPEEPNAEGPIQS